ncbi:unnamed protein product [Clavelina lepadiformis]|uniref:Uncharacterized protein n=1 Tax=Clavelina lepadiformis TaxID=159417 RepID=A0ABP0GQP2_CLALP
MLVVEFLHFTSVCVDLSLDNLMDISAFVLKDLTYMGFLALFQKVGLKCGETRVDSCVKAFSVTMRSLQTRAIQERDKLRKELTLVNKELTSPP